jgi:RimJ/RimL family protein N-acetyltransferase
VSAHPLGSILADAAHGRFPPFDGRVEVTRSAGPPCDALVAFTGHYVLAADVDAHEVTAQWPAGELTLPFSPDAQVWLADRLGLAPLTHDVLLVTIGDGSGPPKWLRRDDSFEHPRVDAALHFRTIDGIWTTEDSSGFVMVGRGLCGRWEVGYEVAPEHRVGGLGRRIVAAARGLVAAGEPLWAQVAPGNAASMRSTLAAGFVPVGAEVLFAPPR